MAKSLRFIMIVVSLAAVGLVSGCVNNSPIPSGKYNQFAKCLTEKGVKMYGASWCSHCNEQKDMFGDAWQYVTYIECANPNDSSSIKQICKDAGVESFPTWIFADNSRFVGTKSLQEIADKSSCSLPQTNINTNSAEVNTVPINTNSASANINTTNQ